MSAVAIAGKLSQIYADLGSPKKAISASILANKYDGQSLDFVLDLCDRSDDDQLLTWTLEQLVSADFVKEAGPLLALQYLREGETTRYRELCGRLVARLEGETAANILVTAQICAYGSDAVSEYRLLKENLGELADKHPGVPLFRRALAALLVCAGKPRAAIDEFEKVPELPSSTQARSTRINNESISEDPKLDTITDWLYLAIAHDDLGEGSQAEQLFSRAQQAVVEQWVASGNKSRLYHRIRQEQWTQLIAEYKSRRAANAVGKDSAVTIDVDRADVEIAIDDQPVPAEQFGRPLTVEPGPRLLSVRKDGRLLMTRIVPLEPGQHRRLGVFSTDVALARQFLRQSTPPIVVQVSQPESAIGSTLEELPPHDFLLRSVSSAQQLPRVDWSKLGALQKLELTGASLTNSQFRPLATLRGTREFSVSNAHRITDAGLEHLAGFTELRAAKLNGTGLTDAGLIRLQNLVQLENLDVSFTRIGDRGLAVLEAMPRLRALNLSGTRITDLGVATLAKLTKLESLSLSHTSVTTDSLAALSHFEKLKKLGLGGWKITDDDIPQLNSLTHLEALDLSQTGVTNAGLKHFKAWGFLEVNLMDTQVDQAGVRAHEGRHEKTRITWGTFRSIIPNEVFGDRDTWKDRADYQDRLAVMWARSKPLKTFRAETVGDGTAGQEATPKEYSRDHQEGVPSELLVQLLEVTFPRATRVDGWNSLRDLRHLTRLAIGSCTSVQDSDMQFVRTCSALEHLELDFTPIGDAGVEQLAGLPKLNSLNLAGTLITGNSLTALARTPQLNSLDIGETNLRDADLAGLAQLSGLIRLRIAETRVGDEGLQFVSQLPIADLDLSGTAVTDMGLQHLGAMASLQRLNLSYTAVTDEGLEVLHGLPYLTSISLVATCVTPGGIAALQDALPQCQLTSDHDLFLATRNLLTQRERQLFSLDMPPEANVFLNLNDPRVAVVLDGIELTAEQTQAPLSLAVGEHKVSFLKGGKLLETRSLRVSGANRYEVTMPAQDDRAAVEALLVERVELLVWAAGGVHRPRFTGYFYKNNSNTDRVAKFDDLPAGDVQILSLDPGRHRTSSGQEKIVALVGGLRSLRSLNLQQTRLDDEMLNQIGLLPMLRELDLTGPFLTDGSMKHFSAMKYLRSLKLSQAGRVGDAGLAQLADLTRLQKLTLSRLRVTSGGLGHLRRLTEITELNLEGTRVDDDALGQLSTLNKLRFLGLDGTQVTGQGLASLQAPNLHRLSLAGSRLDDAGIRNLTRFPQLRWVNLAGTPISLTGVQSLLELPELRYLDLSQTSFTVCELARLREQLPNRCHIRFSPPQLFHFYVQRNSLDPEKDVSISPDGKTLASDPWEKTKRIDDPFGDRNSKSDVSQQTAADEVWKVDLTDMETRRSQPLYGGNRALALAFSADGKFLASGGSDGTILAWDLTTKKIHWSVKTAGANTRCVSYSKDGSILATAGDDASITLRDPHRGEPTRVLKGHTETVRIVLFLAQGDKLVSCSDDHSIRIWDVATGETLATLPAEPATLAVSPNDALLAFRRDGRIVIWDMESASVRREISVDGAAVSAVTFAPAGGELLTGDARGMITHWNLASGAKIFSWQAHTGPIQRLAWAADRGLLSLQHGSNSNSDTVSVWKIKF